VNTLKPLLTVAVLAGIGYGVYVRINSGNDAPPPGIAEGWDTAPKVQLPEMASPSGGTPWGPGGGPSSGGSAPPFGGSRGVAPSGGPSRPSEAPPFNNNPPAVAQSRPPLSADPNGPPAAYRDPAGAPASPGEYAPQRSPQYPAPSDAYGNPNAQDSGAAAPRGSAPDPSIVPAEVEASVADRYRTNPPFDGQAPAGQAPPADAANFSAAIEAAQRELEAGQMAAALQQLSGWHDDPRLAPNDQARLTQLLDQVAGTVIYSTQHLLEPPYEVQPNERLDDIAQRYNVPWQLLAKINGIEDPQNLRPGERLKVVRGPFSAVVSLEKRQLTLLLNGSYAGRFAIGIGQEHPPQEGSYAVSDKVVNPVYRGRDRAIGADDQNNPLGERWIGLGSEMAIHGTNRPEDIGRTDLPGSISLNPRDVEDVYDILSLGSKVTIRR